MYVEIDPSVNEKPVADEREQEQRVQAVAKRIALQFPAQNTTFTVSVSEVLTIYLNAWETLTSQQIQWLDTSPDVYGWSWEHGGFLTLPADAPTVNTYPCQFNYTNGSFRAHLALTQRSGNWLHVNNGRGITIASDTMLLHYLDKAGIPLIGWSQTSWFCDRCDQPGATESDFLCLACSAAKKRFMNEPFEEEHRATPAILVTVLVIITILGSTIRIWQRRK